ncbi:hypothetical protein QE394_001042 [Arthrobacter sp. SORGH_AS 212]|nr:hypothetical protein [Arthrobacter sp. SORGH_AS_0212]
MSIQTERQPAGIRTDGQFAPTYHAEPDTALSERGNRPR